MFTTPNLFEPDWLLIYKIAGDVVRFERTGRHTDLFDE
jgi:mRNA interferase YafQ